MTGRYYREQSFQLHPERALSGRSLVEGINEDGRCTATQDPDNPPPFPSLTMYGKEEFIHPTYQYPISSSPPLRPFWRTPKGILIACFVALLVIGGAVGGAVGGTLSKKTSSSDEADQQPALGSNEQGSATSLTYPGQRPDPTTSSCVPAPTISSPSTSSGGGVGARGYLRRQEGQGSGTSICSAGLEEPPLVPS